MNQSTKQDGLSEPLMSDSDSEAEAKPQTRFPKQMTKKNRTQILLFVLLGVLVTSLLWSLVVIALLSQARRANSQSSYDGSLELSKGGDSQKSGTSSINILHCGDSPDEARAMGCKFQIHTYAWVPAPCFDPVLQEEWLNLRDWEYYTDKYDEGEQVDISVALAGERNLYSTWGQHIEHCAFTWRKFTRSQSGSGVLLTNRDLSYEHVHHCSDALRTKFEHPWTDVNTRVKVEFHMC